MLGRIKLMFVNRCYFGDIACLTLFWVLCACNNSHDR